VQAVTSSIIQAPALMAGAYPRVSRWSRPAWSGHDPSRSEPGDHACTVSLEDEEGVAAAGEIGRGPSDELVARRAASSDLTGVAAQVVVHGRSGGYYVVWHGR
jgi:hypothetical protein